MNGPYDTREQASEAIGSRGWEPGTYQRRSHARLLAALIAADVELGDYDQRIVAWLAGWEPETVEAVADLIRRASHTKTAPSPPRPPDPWPPPPAPGF